MDNPEIYMLKVTISVVIFYAFYRLLIYQNTFLKLRRLTLISIIIFSAIYPLINFSKIINRENIIHLNISTTDYAVSLPEIFVSASKTEIFQFETLLWSIYMFITSLLLLRMFIRIFSIMRLKFNAQICEFNGERIYTLPNNDSPFSFGNMIFMNPSNFSNEDAVKIFTHEKTHCTQLHTIDLLIGEIATIVFWFNPFIWLIRREIRINFEHLADEKVIARGASSVDYQYALLRLCHPTSENKLVNNFNVSQFKRRIIMMNKIRSSRNSILRYISMIPVAAILMLTDAEKIMANEPVVTSENIIENNDVDQVKNKSKAKTNDEAPEDVFMVVQEMPQYPGGNEELFKYISHNIKYPKIAHQQGVQGQIIVSFIVSKDGKIKDIEIVRSIDENQFFKYKDAEGKEIEVSEDDKIEIKKAIKEIDEEAERIVKNMPDWIPGKQKGVNVNVKYSLPISFRLQ